MHKQIVRQVRRRRNHPAWIRLVNGSLRECQVSDVSRAGAKLVVAADITVPTAFELQFSPNTMNAKRCKIIWHHARIFGIQFVD
jgi:PilZ domain-containing protein